MNRNVKWTAERAGVFFDKAKESNRPFHLTIGFPDPHRDETRGGFANDAKEVLEAGLDKEVPAYSREDVVIQEFMTDCKELRTELVQYYTSINRMDLGVGLVLEALRKRGLDQNTLVIFTSDNGAPFINSKTTMYDAGVHLPLLIKIPGQKATVNPNMVSFLDIIPTSLDWAGRKDMTGTKPSPARLGNSILDILEISSLLPQGKWKQYVFGSHTFHEVQNYWPTRYIRSHRFKYHRNLAYGLQFPFAADLYASLSWEGIRNQDGPAPIMIGKRELGRYLFRGPEELFDLGNDPDEVRNVATDDRYKEVLEWCRTTMEQWQYQTRDAWLLKDSVAAVVMEDYMKQGLKLPDRTELDVANPGNRQGPCWHPPQGAEAHHQRPLPDMPVN